MDLWFDWKFKIVSQDLLKETLGKKNPNIKRFQISWNFNYLWNLLNSKNYRISQVNIYWLAPKDKFIFLIYKNEKNNQFFKKTMVFSNLIHCAILSIRVHFVLLMATPILFVGPYPPHVIRIMARRKF
jgi:hypothetical protein